MPGRGEWKRKAREGGIGWVLVGLLFVIVILKQIFSP